MSPAAAMLLLATALQQPVVSASVDRTDLLVGEALLLTIRVESDGAEPVRILEPALSGLELRGTRDVTRVVMDAGVPRRTVTRELRLVALAAGTASIGPVRVEQGGAVVEAVAITVNVRAAPGGAAGAVAPHLQALLDTLRPPVAGEQAMVEVLAVPDQVMLGEQLDLVTLAWFPRSVRLQLRTPPTLSPPDVQGVWAYQQTTATGVVASRRVGAEWYDLYVSHQIVFPLATGTIAVGRATVGYVQPLSYSFLSRELQHEVQSEPVAVDVEPQPAAGRPAGFSGAAGRGLTVAFASSDGALLPGGAATVSVTIQGRGNVALWPEPEVTWPAGVRVYPSGVTIDTDLEDGRIAGRKQFDYLVIADSAGAHVIPGLRYPFFDTERSAYTVAETAGLRLLAPPGTVAAPTRPLPPPLQDRKPLPVAGRAAMLAPWVWLLLVALPPLLLAGVVAARRVQLPRRGPRTTRERDVLALEALDHELRAALGRRLGPSATAEGRQLTAALRAAGVDASLAVHLTRVSERLRQAVFGPPGTADTDELAAEVDAVLRALSGETPGAERRELVQVATVLLLAALLPAGLGAQAPRPEDLFAAGAFRAAADSFTLRVEREPAVAAYWYNLGASFYRLGEDGRARAAWIRAARLAPRDPSVRRALELLPADPLARRIAPTAPVTPHEAWFAAAVAWLLGWSAVAWRRTRRVGAGVLAAAVALGAVGWYVDRQYRRPAAIVLRDDVALRQAPHPAADGARTLGAGDAVQVVRREGAWLLVSRESARGWVLIGDVGRL